MRLLQTFISIHKTIKVRPNRYFFLLVFIIVSLFIQAYMHNYNIVYITMFFTAAVAGTSTLFGMLNLHPVKVSFLANQPFFAKQKSVVTLLASNTENFCAYDLDFTFLDQSIHLNKLEPNSSSALHFTTQFEKRGKQTLKEVQVTSLFPLIHEKKIKKFSIDKSVIIYPKPQGIPLLSSQNIDNAKSGELSDFEGIKEFIQGESLSSIHWASLAKNETLMSKKFLYDEQQNELVFYFDKLSGDLEEKLSQLTLWVLECSKYDLAFKLHISGKIYNSKKGSIDEILTHLALY